MQRSAVLGALVLAAVLGCIGPSGSHREGYKSPTAPPHVPNFNLLGVVREQGTGVPIEGAKVDVGNGQGISDAEGKFSIPGLKGTFFQIIASRDGYDTARTPITPWDGDIHVTLLLKPSMVSVETP